jgi:hypothetical protein
MSTVVTFWQLPEEEPAFLDYLKSTGDIVGIPWSKVTDRALLEPAPLQTLISQDPDSVLLGQRELLGEIPINTFNEDGSTTYAVAVSKAPMLIYGRGKWRAKNKLGASNLSGDWTTVSDDGSRIIDNPEAFVKWGRKAMAWVRKRTPFWHLYERYRTTAAVAEAIKHGLEIVP